MMIHLTPIQTIITIMALSCGIIITRFLPFILFPENKKTPRFVKYLGNVLPPAMMGLLVIYCFKGISVLKAPYGLPELIAAVCVISIHLWKRNVLISISAGTVVYMALVQLVF